MTSYAENLQEFYPIPELKRTDSDVTLLFLRVWSNEPLARGNDPWFSFTQP